MQLASLRKQNVFSGDWTDIKIVYGNRHETVPSRGNVPENTHKWTMFVKIAGDNSIDPNRLIEKVRFGLHETFGMEYMDVKAGPNKKFEMTFTGWGTFDIPITIHFKRELCLEPENRKMDLNHYLCFNGNGKWRSVNLPIKKTVAIKLGIPIQNSN